VNEIVDAVTWCHSNGVALVDLKPSNLMLKGGGWKLIDSEGSRIIGQECHTQVLRTWRVTATFGVEGTQGVVAQASMDLWALACIIYVSYLVVCLRI
jgi:serine/threonine protein kinase